MNSITLVPITPFLRIMRFPIPLNAYHLLFLNKQLLANGDRNVIFV